MKTLAVGRPKVPSTLLGRATDMTVKVTTNNASRLLVDAYEMTAKEREAFDYLDWDAIESGEDSPTFVRYRGELIPLNDFSASWGLRSESGLPDWLEGWDGFLAGSMSTGLVIKFVRDDNDRVIIGSFVVED